MPPGSSSFDSNIQPGITTGLRILHGVGRRAQKLSRIRRARPSGSVSAVVKLIGRSAGRGALVVALISCTDAPPCPGDQPFSLVLQGGTLVDGSGAAAVPGDVAFCADTIAIVGSVSRRAATNRVIDVSGQIVSPGFIDMLGQSERNLLLFPLAVSKISQGITTEVTGEVESVWPQASGLPAGYPRWNTLAEYFSFLEQRGTAINLGTYITAGSLRRVVMGDNRDAPSTDQMTQMQNLLDQGLRDGALGLAAALLYAPADAFTTSQLVQLSNPLARYGAGYVTHLRNESDSLVQAVQEALTIGEQAGVNVHIHHLKAAGKANWGKLAGVIAAIDSARARGVRISADVYPYTASSTGLSVLLPGWARTGGEAAIRRRLSDPSTRNRLQKILEAGEWRPSAIVLDHVHTARWQFAVGKSLEAVAAMLDTTPAAVAISILAENGDARALFFSMDEKDLRTALAQPWVSIGSDAGALYPHPRGRGHPRAFGTFPRVLARYVRDEKLLTLEEAVRRMTSLAASQAGIARRGLLRPGYYADVVVFDPKLIQDNATYSRPQVMATGVSLVVVNGVPVFENGKATGALPGRAIRRNTP